MSHTVADTAEAGPSVLPRPGAVVAVLAFAGIAVSLMQTLVVPLLPELPGLLHASAADTAWAVTATLLSASVATPMAGRLGDMYGKRRMLLASLTLMVTGSVVAALAHSLAPFVIGRTLQGLAAGVVPLGISIMRDELPTARLGTATATMSSSLGVGGALGLPLAALLADHTSWHMLFWAAAGIGTLVIALVLTVVPESKTRTGGRFDLLGAAGLSAALVCLLLAISKGADWGWASGITVGLFAAGVVVLLVWARWELRARQPMVDLRTNARPQVLFTNASSIMFGFSTMPVRLVQPQVLQLPEATGYGMGRSLLAVGLILAPQGLVMMAVSPWSARLSAAKGPKTSLMSGALVVAAGYGLGCALMSAVWQLVLVSVLLGVGIGLAYGAMPALVMAAVPRSETAAANSFNALMRSVGTAVASAVAGVVLAHLTLTVGPAAFPSENGLRIVMLIGAVSALLAMTIAIPIPGRRPSTEPEHTEHTEHTESASDTEKA